MTESGPFGLLYTEIERRIRIEFGKTPDIIRGVPRFGEIKKLPAFFIEMVDLDPEGSTGTGEVEVMSRWEIRVLISAKQDQAEIMARNASARLATLFHDKVLESEFSYPMNYQGASDDNFDLKVRLYESWVNLFEIKLRLGEDAWGRWDFYEENLAFDQYLDHEFLRGEVQRP
jgi:hypothetical protein